MCTQSSMCKHGRGMERGALVPTLHCTLQPFLCVYGGDPAHVDTIGKVMKQVKEAYGCHILAIQAAGKHEDWTDAVFM